MASTSRARIAEAERRFPVRVRIAVPAGGLGQRLSAIYAWLDAAYAGAMRIGSGSDDDSIRDCQEP